MKKILMFLVVALFAVSASAQTYKYKAWELAYSYVNEYGQWTEWSDWEKASVLVVISLDREKINIYSQTPQEYDIYEYGQDWETDDQGGSTWTLKCVNADGLRCEVRLRSQSNGVLQLYVEFNDARWVYNIEQKQ